MNKMVLLVTGFLVLIMGVTAYLNSEDLAAKQEFQENALISVALQGEDIKSMDMAEIKALGEEEFKVIGRGSNTPDTEYTFVGVPLRTLIAQAGIGLADYNQVLVRAIDGYIVALNALEVQVEDNIYLVYEQDGDYLKPKEQGGSGPYQVVIRNDQFSQRWCKFVAQIDVR